MGVSASRTIFGLLGFIAAISSCTSGGDDPSSACRPGESIACNGPGGCVGGQICKADGSGFGVCDCGGSGSDSGSGVDGASPPVDATTAPTDGATADASFDAPVDASSDGPKDASPDVLVDAGVDGGPPDPLAQMSVSQSVTCFAFASGKVRCAGKNDDIPSQGPILGDGLLTHPGCGANNDDCSAKLVNVVGLTDAVEVRTGGSEHVCVRKADNTVACWGQNAEGQLGDGTVTPHAAPVVVPGLADVVQLSVGGDNTCVRKADGTVLCWGENRYGNIGDGTRTRRLVPTPVVGLTDAIHIAARDNGGCAIRAGGQVVCWGINHYGALGDGVVKHSTCYNGWDCSTVPVNVAGMPDATQLSAGSIHTCAVRADGTTWCWGLNTSGQLGDGVKDHGNYPTWDECGMNDCSPIPIVVSGITSPTRIVAAADTTCVLKASGVVSCWGSNYHGGLGMTNAPNAPTERYIPGDVPGIANALDISGNGDNMCALRPNGRVTCWGWNVWGSLANGGYSTVFTPKDVVW